MESLINGLPYIQTTLAIVLIGAVLLQQRGAGLGGALGGGDEGTIHYERRGSERTLFRATIMLAVAFVIATALPLFVAPQITSEIPSVETTSESPIDVQVVTEDGTTEEVPSSIVVEELGGSETAPTPSFPLGQ